LNVKLPDKIKGFRSKPFNALRDYCKAITPLPSPDLLVNTAADGTRIALKRRILRGLGTAATATVLQPFDIDDVATDTFSIWDYQGRSNFVSIAGGKVTVAPGSGFTWHGGDSPAVLKWTCAAITESTYVYLAMERAGTPGATLTKGTTFPDGDDDTEYHPLWYIPWVAEVTGPPLVAAHIDAAGIINMRGGIRLPAMA
jgi:hypothetical protein